MNFSSQLATASVTNKPYLLLAQPVLTPIFASAKELFTNVYILLLTPSYPHLLIPLLKHTNVMTPPNEKENCSKTTTQPTQARVGNLQVQDATAVPLLRDIMSEGSGLARIKEPQWLDQILNVIDSVER